MTGTNDYQYLLPNFDATLNVSDDFLVRFNASRTLTRPPLGQITPVLSVPTSPRVGALTASGGNPQLMPYLSDSLDLGAEWYYAPNSILSVDVYNKNVTNFIVQGTKQGNINGVIDAAFAGRPADTDSQFGKALAEGSLPGAIMSAALRQVAQLHKMRLAMDDGASAEDVMFRVPPPIHFSRKRTVETILRAWTAPRLTKAMEQLAETSMETRRQSKLAESLAHRALMALAVNARRRES